MVDKKTNKNEESIKNTISEITNNGFSRFKDNYDLSVDTEWLKNFVVDKTVSSLEDKSDGAVEKSKVEEVVHGWLKRVEAIKEKEVVFVEDEERDSNDVQSVLDELGVKIFNDACYKSIQKITDLEIDKIKEQNSTINIFITDVLDSTLSEYSHERPKRLIREIQLTPYENLTQDDKDDADAWIEVAKNNLVAVTDVVKKLKKRHIIMITKIANDYLHELIVKIYNDKHCADCIDILFCGKSDKEIIEYINKAKTLKLLETGNLTLFSKPYYEEKSEGHTNSNQNNNTALYTDIDEYNIELEQFQNKLKETLLMLVATNEEG